jgi:Leucine-rich repeat (LRR) protein
MNSNITKIMTLEALNFYGNYLDSLPDLSLLPLFNSINIGGNQFKSIPVSILKIRRRITFDAPSNQITHIPDEVKLMKFGTFNVTNNPLLPNERAKVKKIVSGWYVWF